MSVVIETTLGDLTVDLYLEQRPMTCKNFLKLCKIKYYNQCTFHKIQRDFIAQSGDPTNTGSGGESVFARVYGEKGRFIEAEKKPKIKHDRFGLLSMVNNDEGLVGSQFFFTLCHSLDYLDTRHTVFGEVVEGQEILVQLNDTICDGENRPYQDIMITHTVVLDDPFPEIEGLEIPDKSPQVNFAQLLESDRIGIGENIVDEDKTTEEVEEEMKDKEAKQRALVLEMIGDIPDADIAPPENVLFICKLNPVTRDEDLEIIFSRFGRILSCEIIKDDRSGESLQYGFIEFERQEDCEQAYFKMDNVLIDDRRIHVDFSQSVSKLKWRGKGRGVTYMNEDGKNVSGKEFSHHSKEYVNQLGHKSKGGGGESRRFEPTKRRRSPSPAEQKSRYEDRSARNREVNHRRSRSRERKRDASSSTSHLSRNNSRRSRSKEAQRSHHRSSHRDTSEHHHERHRRDEKQSSSHHHHHKSSRHHSPSSKHHHHSDRHRR